MYYLQSRYYDAKICRFINADSELAGATGDLHGYNLYSYCFNTPVMYSDYAGNWPEWINIIPDAVTNEPYWGRTSYIGVGTPGIEGHVTWG